MALTFKPSEQSTLQCVYWLLLRVVSNRSLILSSWFYLKHSHVTDFNFYVAKVVLLMHGWPGSFVEYLEVIRQFTDPVKFGGNESEAIAVVCPSLPGFGFSDAPQKEGLLIVVRLCYTFDYLSAVNVISSLQVFPITLESIVSSTKIVSRVSCNIVTNQSLQHF